VKQYQKLHQAIVENAINASLCLPKRITSDMPQCRQDSIKEDNDDIQYARWFLEEQAPADVYGKVKPLWDKVDKGEMSSLDCRRLFNSHKGGAREPRS